MDRLLNKNNKKIIIGSSLKEVDRFIKNLSEKKKSTIFDYEETTIINLAKDILLLTDKFSDYKFIDNSEAEILFYSFLMNNIKGDYVFDLIPKESLSLSTSNNAYQALNKVRYAKLLKDNHKYEEMISSFEDYLSSRKLFDNQMVLTKAIDLLKTNKDLVNKDCIYLIIPSLKNKLSYLEKEFLKSLTNNDDINSCFLNLEIKKGEIKKIKVPTYGFSNTIKYIIKEIKDNKYNLSDVTIYSTKQEYYGLIRGYFENNKIPYIIEDGESLLSDPFGAFMVCVLYFITENYSIERLYPIYKLADEKYSLISSLKNLKSNRLQILNFINVIEDSDKKQFLNDLLDIRSEGDSIDLILLKVLDYCLKYFDCDNEIKEFLIKKAEILKSIDLSSFSYKDRINFILEVLSRIRMVKKNEDNEESKVHIYNFNEHYIYKKHNFFIGLSSSEFVLKEVESPLISDDELKDIINCKDYYVSLEKNKNDEFINNLNELLNSQENGEQYFVCSTYDSVGFKTLVPSSYYLNIETNNEEVKKDKDEKDKSFYEDLLINHADYESVDEYLYPQTKENNEKVKNKDLSPSRIDTIIECPLKHIYSLIYDEIELDTLTDKWLDASEEGNFAHEVLEKYFKDGNTTFDEGKFNSIFNDILDKYKTKIPFINTSLQDAEAEKIKKYLVNYLKRYEDDNFSFKPIECEFKIEKENSVSIGILDYKVNGIIDRIDYYIDDINDLHIRIVDYKTFSTNSFEKHKTDKTFTQSVVYPFIINQYINDNYDDLIKKLGNFNKKDDYNITFKYEILKEGIPFESDYSDVKETVTNALTNYDELIKKPVWENFIRIYEPDIKKMTEHNKGKCEYCKFREYCVFKKLKGDNCTWAQAK